MKFNKGVVAAASVVAIIVVCIYLASNRTPDAPVDGKTQQNAVATSAPTPKKEVATIQEVSLAYSQYCANFAPQEPLPCVNQRNNIPLLLDRLNITGEGAEIGVQSGAFSKVILEGWKKCTKFYAVDPWMWQETYDDKANVAQTAQDALYQKTVGDLRPFKHATVLRLTSEQAAKLIPDDSLSFVYIDARHDYSSVLQDLSLWYPKLKRGGVLAGHDFIDIDEMPEWRVQPDGSVETLRAVKSAVLNFTTRICRQLCVCWDEYKWCSFYFANGNTRTPGKPFKSQWLSTSVSAEYTLYRLPFHVFHFPYNKLLPACASQIVNIRTSPHSILICSRHQVKPVSNSKCNYVIRLETTSQNFSIKLAKVSRHMEDVEVTRMWGQMTRLKSVVWRAEQIVFTDEKTFDSGDITKSPACASPCSKIWPATDKPGVALLTFLDNLSKKIPYEAVRGLSEAKYDNAFGPPRTFPQ
ncbi:Protoporphyrinogen oxidase chloroplastic [Pelomyxa schiedti]|nr:Protoporphyrinogen oxidase chloroplastic [Pelomyxa schiedti]